MSLRNLTAAWLLLAIAPTVAAEPVRMGKISPEGGLATFSGNGSVPFTFIDAAHPALVSGALTLYKIRWRQPGSGACAGAYRVRVLRPGTTFGTWTIVATFALSASDATEVAISPAVAVQAGDVLAVTVYKTIQECGSVLLTPADASESTLLINGDIVSGVAPANVARIQGYVLNLVARAGTSRGRRRRLPKDS